MRKVKSGDIETSEESLSETKFKEKYCHCPDCNVPIGTDAMGYYFCSNCKMVFKKEKQGCSGKWDLVKTGETLYDMEILVSENVGGIGYNIWELCKPHINFYDCKICKKRVETNFVRKILVNLKLCPDCYKTQMNNIINNRIQTEIKEKENIVENEFEYL